MVLVTNNCFSISKTILGHELGERIIEIYTNKKALKSNALGRTDIGYPVDGKASLIGQSHGLWLRGFNSSDELFKPLTTSLKEFMQSYSAMYNLGLGIEKDGYSEVVRLEEKSFFYNRNTTIKLPNQVKKVKRSEAIDYYYSGIEIGYEKGATYEEAFGLVEYNGKTNFSTVITGVKNLLSLISTYRSDSFGCEFARRKYKLRYGTQDTKYDTEVFSFALKRGISSVFNLRKWQDDFEIEPTGTYSPETAYNLILSPFNCLLRHGWEIAAGMTKNLSDYIRYTTSTANSNLKTKLIGGNEYAENGEIINNLPIANFNYLIIRII